jgi:SAM-dependent methyltransferase
MPKYWTKPIYQLKSNSGEEITIDVTSSVSAGLIPSGVIVDDLIPFLKNRHVERVLDFGAGALRHTFPLLDAGFQVCAVEFEEGFKREVSKKAREKAQKHPNFSALIWPKDFIKSRRRFDAAILAYVLQIMPVPNERDAVLKYIYRKLIDDSYLFYSARYGQLSNFGNDRKVGDGYFMYPKREMHTFYREFTTELTHKMIEKVGFKRIRSLSRRGTDQMILYAKGSATWA